MPVASYTSARLVAEARSWLGTPYRHQASCKGAGCDCLGLVRGLWRAVHGEEPETLPAYSPDWAESGGGERLAIAARAHLVVVALDEAGPGDVVLFRLTPHHPARHAGVLSQGAAAGGFFIHAWQGSAVVETRLVAWWRRKLAYAFRFPGIAPTLAHHPVPATDVPFHQQNLDMR